MTSPSDGVPRRRPRRDIRRFIEDGSSAITAAFHSFDSLTGYENSWKEMDNSEEMKKMQEAMKGYTEMYQTGSREIFQVW